MLRIEKLTAGSVGAGTRFRATALSGRWSVDMVTELTEYDRPSRLGYTTITSTLDIDGTLTFQQVGQSTRMRWAWDVRPKGTTRLLTPIVSAIGRQEERTWQGLKRHLENGAGEVVDCPNDATR